MNNSTSTVSKDTNFPFMYRAEMCYQDFITEQKPSDPRLQLLRWPLEGSCESVFARLQQTLDMHVSQDVCPVPFFGPNL